MSRFSMDWSELSLQLIITFAHFLWQACVVGLVLFVAQHVVESLRDSGIFQLFRVSKKRVSLGETDLRGANIRYAIACTAFFSLPICVVATFAWVHQARGPIVMVAGGSVASPSSPMAAANEATPTMANDDIPVLPSLATPMKAEVPATEPSKASTLMVKPQASPVHRIQAFAPYLLLAYLVGVGFMLARFLISIIGSSRLRRTIQPIADLRLLQTIAEQCARIGLKRVPLVALCQRVSVPVVVGIVKPMILLPPTLLCGLDPNQIAAILSHELAHIRRYDLIVNLLQRVVEALLFFHPVTWWISRRVSVERENCCDDVAAGCMGRLPYAGTLLQMAELCIGNDRPRAATLATLAATGSNSTDFGYRIRRLIGAEETTRVGFTRRSFSAGLALISLVTISLVAWGQSQETEKKAVASVVENPAYNQDTGALKGRIALDGVAPKLPKLRVNTPASPWLTKRATDEERKKYEASLVEIRDESILVDADQGLANAFVYLARAPSNWQPTQEDLKPFTLTMQDDRFAPRAAIIRTGQDVRLNNLSVGADNFAFETMKNGGQNRAVGARAESTLEHPFAIPERIPIQAKSQMHPWKTSFLLPLEYPFAAITDSRGKFSIEGLPPGEHSFLIWHERTGWLEKSLVINIQAGKTTEVDRSYSADRMKVVAPSAFGDPVSGISIRLQPLVPIKLNSAPPEIAFETNREGNLDLILSEVPTSENRISVDGEIYSHSGLPLTEAQPHYRSVKDRIAWKNTLSPRIVMDGQWKSVKDGHPLKLAPGKHVLRFGWGGFHPLGDNPQLPDKTKPAIVWSNLVELTMLDYAEVAIAYDSGLASYDLDTEKGIGPTASLVAEDQLAEFDLRAGHGAAGLILTGQLRNFIKVGNESWSTVSMKEIRERLTIQNDSERIEPQLLSKQGEKLPSTWIVKTNQGAKAILQIEFRDDIKTKFSGIVKGFVVRYRLFPIGSAKRIDLSGTRKDLAGRVKAAVVQRDKASKDSRDYPRLNHWVQIKELHLAQFDFENGVAGIDLPDAPEATPERLAELLELLRFRWGLPVDGIQVGIARTDDRFRFTSGEKIPFQIFIRNITQEPITQSLRWCDAKNMTASLRRLAGLDTDKNIFLSLRPNSVTLQPTELRLEPGVTMELPLGQFEMDTFGLHSGVYHVDGHFPVVFPNQEGELATRLATPVDSSAMPHDLFFRFELVGTQPTPQNKPADELKEVAEYADVQWGKTVYGLQAGARYRNYDDPDNKADVNNLEAKVEPTQHPIRIGDTIKTEVLVRNVSDQPITVRFHPAAGSEVQLLAAMQSNLTEVASRNIMRRTDVPITHDIDRTVERTLQPSEVFVAAQQDFEIQLLLDGRERQLDLPKANRHWVKGSGDYTYTAYLKLNITDSLSVGLHSGRLKMPILADENPLGSNQRATSEPRESGGLPVNAELSEISALIAAGRTIPRELNGKFQELHLKLTAEERLKSVKLLEVPDFVMQVILPEPTYALEEKVALLSELKDRDFNHLEFGLQEWMWNIARDYAKVDPAATREWLAQFKNAEYGVGMGLTEVLQAAKQQDSMASLKILRGLSEAEAECLVNCGEIPDYDLSASDWLKEVEQFQSQRLRTYLLKRDKP